MEYVNVDDILKIIINFCHENEISVSAYAKRAGISKSWISRLMTEKNKKISLQVAQDLLLVSGHTLKITKAGIQVKKINRLGKLQ